MIPENLDELEEDVTSQGGWLFADSFLALMVIFLATISFVPAISSPEVVGIGSGGAATKQVNISEGLTLAYDQFNSEKISQDIQNFISENRLRDNVEAIYTQVVGGYDEASENAFQGNLRAIEFSIKLREANLPVFKNSQFMVSNSNNISKNKVVLRITLAESVE